MQRRTPRLVMAGAVLVLAAVVIAGATGYPHFISAAIPEASTPTGPAAGQDKPTVPFWHVWTDDKGVSHKKRCKLSDFQFQSISKGAAASWIDRQSTPGATVVVLVLPVGWVGEWH